MFREYLGKNGFLEIHSPKLQGAATESGASVFKVSYFKGIGLDIVLTVF
jgi:aspartyl-tRNA synthetase